MAGRAGGGSTAQRCGSREGTDNTALPRPPGATDRRRTRMFTGIVEDLGEVEAVEHAGDSARVFIRSAKVTHGTRPGDSIAVNGVCLTVTGLLNGMPAAASPPPAPAAP